MGVGTAKGMGVESAREPGGLRPGWRKNREMRGCSLAQWVQRWVGGREDGWGGVDFSYEGRVYENLAEVEGGEETHSPAFGDVIKDSTFRPASFSLPSFP